MTTKDLGSIVRVRVSARDVETFNSEWPCSGIPERAISFDFERKNGDLVDIYPNSESFDGAALSALCDDAKRFAGL